MFRALVTVRHGEEESLVAQPAIRELFAADSDQDTVVTSLVEAPPVCVRPDR